MNYSCVPLRLCGLAFRRSRGLWISQGTYRASRVRPHLQLRVAENAGVWEQHVAFVKGRQPILREWAPFSRILRRAPEPAWFWVRQVE